MLHVPRPVMRGMVLVPRLPITILAVTACLLAYESKALLIGEAADPELVSALHDMVLEKKGVTAVGQVLTVHSAPDQITAMLSVDFDDDITARHPCSPLVSPEVEGVVKIDVRQQGRCRRALRRPYVTRRPRPVFHHACGQPFPVYDFHRLPVSASGSISAFCYTHVFLPFAWSDCYLLSGT